MTEELRKIFGERLIENEPLSKHTNFHLGGPAKWFVEVKGKDEVIEAVKIAKAHDVPFFVLGGGSNVLASDKGYEGLVIKIGMREFEIDGTTVYAEAGVLTVGLARATVQAGLEGLEWAVSLPGTIGGAVRGNAGCFGGEVKDSLVSAEALVDGEVVEMSNRDLEFGYRHSVLKDRPGIVLSARFELVAGDKDRLKKKADEVLEKRKTSQPFHAGTAGCMFKNFEIDPSDMERLKQTDIPSEMIDHGQISVGWLIEHLGLKGLRIGGAVVSDIHGNFVLTDKEAKASDVLGIVDQIKIAAKDRYGIDLKIEVQLM